MAAEQKVGYVRLGKSGLKVSKVSKICLNDMKASIFTPLAKLVAIFISITFELALPIELGLH